MTLKVRIRLLATETSEGAVHHSTNMKVLSVAEALRKSHAGSTCDEHPDQDHEVTVVALEQGQVHIDKSSLCCDAFREKLSPVPEE